MREHDDVALKDYTFTMADEVREKIQSVENLHELISEESVEDLHKVDVSDGNYLFIKRCLDIVISVLGLMALLVPILIVAAVVYLDDPGEVIFSQNRVGRHGRKFKLYKFRTMKTETPKYMSTMELKDPDQYMTRCGRLLRKTSLDEIPQLINVLKGDMSLVGPRPLISDEYEIHAMRMRFGVYSLRPGLTGLAQINGRDLVSPEEKVRWDVRYLEDCGLWTDFKILLSTVPKVFRCVGISDEQ